MLQRLIRFIYSNLISYKIRRILFGIRPILVDIGAAGGMPYIWRITINKGLVEAYMFDLSPDWEIKSTVHILRYAIWDKNTEKIIYHTKHPGCSSLCEPDPEIVSFYPCSDWFEVICKSQINVTRFDTVSQVLDLPEVDYLKMDIQGSEGQCLNSFGDRINNVCAIESEVHFRKLYKESYSFYEINQFLYEKGFILRDIKPQGPFGNELIEVNAYWTRREPTKKQKKLIEAWELMNNIRKPIYP